MIHPDVFVAVDAFIYTPHNLIFVSNYLHYLFPVTFTCFFFSILTNGLNDKTKVLGPLSPDKLNNDEEMLSMCFSHGL